MRICLVSAHFSPHIGGVETHVERLAYEHHRAGHDVTVITQTPASDAAADFPFKVIRLATMNRSTAFPVGRGVRAAIDAQKFDVLHVHNYHTALFAQAARARSIPLVLTPHFHGTSQFAAGRAAHTVWSRANAGTWRRASEVIAVAVQEQELLLDRFPVLSDRLSVIPNGVDIRTPKTVAESRTLPERAVLTVGRLERHKHTERIIAALPDVPAATLIIVGTGPEEEHLKAVAHDHGVHDRVQFWGRVSDEELWQAYRSAATFVTMSEIEAFGLTLAEAMTAGTPVVASAIRAHEEVAAQAADVPALLLPTQASAREVAAAMVASLSTPRVPERARFLSWERVAAEVRLAYERAVTTSARLQRP